MLQTKLQKKANKQNTNL